MLSRLKQVLQQLKFEVSDRVRKPKMADYLGQARQIPGWATEDEMIYRWRICYTLPPNSVIVEIGSFLGRSTVIAAGARKQRGNGLVHCVDTFDASGDSFSVSFYRAIQSEKKASLRSCFDENVRRAGVTSWVRVHQGTEESIATQWTEPIDMLILDGDHSPEGARSAYENWIPFLKGGGILVIVNSSDRVYAEGHDGNRRVFLENVRSPNYIDISCVGSTTYARKSNIN